MLLALSGALYQGILWGIMVLGVFITYKMLDIADLTVDGSFALGGCVAATASVTLGLDPLVAILLGTLAGVIAGAVTGLLHTLFDIPAILAGILTQIALWSINLRIMGKSNVPLLNVIRSSRVFPRFWASPRALLPSLSASLSPCSASSFCTGSSAQKSAQRCVQPARTSICAAPSESMSV